MMVNKNKVCQTNHITGSLKNDASHQEFAKKKLRKCTLANLSEFLHVTLDLLSAARFLLKWIKDPPSQNLPPPPPSLPALL